MYIYIYLVVVVVESHACKTLRKFGTDEQGEKDMRVHICIYIYI